MKSPEKANEDEASFVNINLDDRQTPRPTMDTLATPISNLRMGWMSQMSLQSHSNSDTYTHLTLPTTPYVEISVGAGA